MNLRWARDAIYCLLVLRFVDVTLVLSLCLSLSLSRDIIVAANEETSTQERFSLASSLPATWQNGGSFFSTNDAGCRHVHGSHGTQFWTFFLFCAGHSKGRAVLKRMFLFLFADLSCEARFFFFLISASGLFQSACSSLYHYGGDLMSLLNGCVAPFRVLPLATPCMTLQWAREHLELRVHINFASSASSCETNRLLRKSLFSLITWCSNAVVRRKHDSCLFLTAALIQRWSHSFSSFVMLEGGGLVWSVAAVNHLSSLSEQSWGLASISMKTVRTSGLCLCLCCFFTKKIKKNLQLFFEIFRKYEY